MGEWQPIETAPRDGTVIDGWLQFYRDGVPSSGSRVADMAHEVAGWVDGDGDEIEWQDTFGKETRLTHWMPLPAPPEVG
jgi:hypothetical protein